MEKGWVKILSYKEEYKAQIALDRLENEGVRGIIMNKKDSSYLFFGDIEIYVKQEDALRALNIIQEKE